MARIFITGSADGLGQLAAEALIAQGHQVVIHARNEQRGQEALFKAPGAESVVTADLGSIEQTKKLASKLNALPGDDRICVLEQPTTLAERSEGSRGAKPRRPGGG